MEGGERMRGSPTLLLPPRSVSTEAKRDELLMAPFPVGTAKTNQILDRFPLMTENLALDLFDNFRVFPTFFLENGKKKS